MSQPEADLPAAQPMLPLEERMQRLEAAVAALQQTPETAGQPQQANGELGGNRLVAPEILNPPPAAIAMGSPLASPVASKNRFFGVEWLFVGLYREVVAIFRMCGDLHYHVAWSTRLVTAILLPLILTSQWWNPIFYVPLVPPTVCVIVDKLVDLVLAFVMFKALSREARRYMETRNLS